MATFLEHLHNIVSSKFTAMTPRSTSVPSGFYNAPFDFATIRGNIGEANTRFGLGMAQTFLNEGVVLSDLYIPKANGESSQIDAIYITARGVFVVEVKNYSGWIFGNEDNINWTVCYRGGKKISLYNPILQNRNHVKYLKKYIGDGVRCFSFIVFSDKCEFKNLTDTNSEAYIVKNSELTKLVMDLWNVAPVILDQNQIYEIYNKLLPLTKVCNAEKKKHIDNINEKYADGAIVCPLCGGRLIVRTATKGKNIGKKFMGCSNFPKCKFTKNVT